MNGYFIILIAFISLLIGATGAYFVKSDIDKLRLQHAISAQQSADNTSCNADKKITEDADAKLKKDNDALAARIAALNSVPARCVPIVTNSAKPASAKRQPGQTHTRPGVASAWLINYAGQCERDRLQLNDLIDFVYSVWSRKQAH